MSTRRDRAARAIREGIWVGFPGGEDEMAEGYRIADMVLAEIDRIPDISELIEASSLGTPHAKAARASVSDQQAQRAIEVANRIRAGARAVDVADRIQRNGTRPDPDCPDDFLCAFRFSSGELCERSAGHSGDHTPNGNPKTDGGVGAPPALVGADAPPAPQGEATVPPAPPSLLPRPFLLFRTRDISGKSGVGIVAWGCLWPDGTVALRWATEHRSTVHWDGLSPLLAVHGHQGATVLQWIDELSLGGA